MAISWMSALKVIPWGDVIEAAPAVVKGARKIFTRSQQAEAPLPVPGEGMQERVAQLEASVVQLQEQQRASAQLVETLAEQNARVVQAVEILRVRTRMLLVVSAVLAVALFGVIAWSLR